MSRFYVLLTPSGYRFYFISFTEFLHELSYTPDAFLGGYTVEEYAIE